MEKSIIIIGARGKIEDIPSVLKKINKFSTDRNTTIQFFDASEILGREHLLVAAEHALRAFERTEQIANSLALEILVRAACERQIHSALARIGIQPDTQKFAIIGLDTTDTTLSELLTDLGLERDDSVLETPDLDVPTLLHDYGVSLEESALVGDEQAKDLIFERMTALWFSK